MTEWESNAMATTVSERTGIDIGVATAAQTYTEGLYSARPAAGTNGDEFYATDLGVSFTDNGTSWTVTTDPWGFKFFEDEGFLTSGMAVEKAGLNTIPAQDNTILPSGATFTIVSGSVGDFNYGGTGNVSLAGWDLSVAKSRILFICGLHAGKGGTVGLTIQQSSLAGSEMDNGYNLSLASGDNMAIRKEDAGFTQLAEGKDVNLQPDSEDIFDMVAFLYDDDTGELTGFIRRGPHEWIQCVTTTDSTFTTMGTVAVRVDDGPDVNAFIRMSSPFFVFTS